MYLKFMSPLINMYIPHIDYYRFLKNAKYYMEEKIEFLEYTEERGSSKCYPIGILGDVRLHFNHSKTFEEAVDGWERRKKRINWENILVMAYEENEHNISDFLGLPYKKKVCFVPFPTREDGLYYVSFTRKMPERSFGSIVNGMATGEFQCYSVLDLVKDGKIVKYLLP